MRRRRSPTTTTDRIDAGRWRALAILAGSILLLLKNASLHGHGDFLFFYIAARRFLHGLNPYNPHVTLPIGFPLGFSYPPLALLLLAPAAALPFNAAVWCWDILCMMCYMGSIFLWIEILTGQTASFRTFALVAASTLILPSFITFIAHHLIHPIFFFLTAAIYLVSRRKNDLAGGFLAACALLKPHLVFLPVLGLLFRSTRRGKFLGGLIAGLALNLIPLAVSPSRHAMLEKMIVRNEATHSYFLEDQSLVANFLQRTFFRQHNAQLTSAKSAYGFVIKSGWITRYSTVKLAVALASWAVILGWAFFKKPTLSDPEFYVLLLSGNLLFNFYSHMYDSVLILPLFLLGLDRLARIYDLSQIACVCIVVNIVVAYAANFLSPHTEAHFPYLGLMSAAYALISLGLIYYSRLKLTRNLHSRNERVTV